MRAGQLRHRITITRLSETKNAAGEMLESYTEAATVWASVKPLGGSERFAAAHDEALVTHLVSIRYRSDIAFTPDMQLDFNGRKFDIDAIINVDERNREYQIHCVEKV